MERFKSVLVKYMKIVWLFPIILIALDLCAAAVYFITKDWKHGLYWVFAACISWAAMIL